MTGQLILARALLLLLASSSWSPSNGASVGNTLNEQQTWPLPPSSSCDPVLRRRYCQTESCLRCDVGPACPVRGPRALPSGDPEGTTLIRGAPEGPERAELLKMLDRERRRRARPSSLCIPTLKWDDELSGLAQAWADQCALVEYHNSTFSAEDRQEGNLSRMPRALHHDDQRRRHPGLAQSVHWARTSTRDLTAETVRALLASEVRTEDGLLTDGAVLGTTEEEEEEGVIRWGHANRVGCGWIQFSLDERSDEVLYDNFMVCNYGVAEGKEGEDSSCEGEGGEGGSESSSFVTYYSATEQVIRDVKGCLKAVRCRRRQMGFNLEEEGEEEDGDCSSSVESCLASPSGFRFVPLRQLRSFARSVSVASGGAGAEVEASRCKIDTILCSLSQEPDSFDCKKRVGRCLPLLDGEEAAENNNTISTASSSSSSSSRRPLLFECQCVEGMVLSDGSRGDCRGEESEDGPAPFCYVRRSPCLAVGEDGEAELSSPDERLNSLVHLSYLSCREQRRMKRKRRGRGDGGV